MRTSSLAIVAGAAALALGGCGQKAQTPASPDNGAAIEDNANLAVAANDTMAVFSPGQAFANSAAASDAFEIASSRLALTSSRSAAVKKFAQSMIDAHTQSTAKLKAAAAAASPAINPDPALSSDQQSKLDGLRGKTGAEFDRAYVSAQRDAHEQTHEALRGYATSGDVPSLRAFANDTAPTVAAHLNMANALKP